MTSEQIEDQKFYLQVWKEVLFQLLDYTPQQAEKWIAANTGPWETFHAVYVSDFPEARVLGALISEQSRNRIGGRETEKLKRDILQAIELGNPKWSSNEGYDWPAARQRIKQVFQSYGVPDGYTGK